VQSKIENQYKKHHSQQEKDGLPYRYIFETAADGLIISNIQTGILVEANPVACSMHGFQLEELIGRPVTDLIEPACRDRYLAYVMAVRAHNTSEVSLTHRRKDGSNFSIEMRGAKIDFSGQAFILSTLHDVSHWVLAEKTLQQQAKTHLREQSTLLEISKALTYNLELKPGIVLDQLRELIKYMRAVRFDLEDMTLVAISARGSTILEQAVPFNIRLSDPQILTTLYNDHIPILATDVWSDEPKAQFLRSILNNKVSGLLEGMQACMWVPLVFSERLLGGLGIAHSQKGFFTAHRADLALMFANQAAIALNNAKLYKHAQEFAVREERQRLARDLHDSINQSLFSAGLIAEVLPRLWDRDRQEARRSLEDLRHLTSGAQAEMRVLLAELRPSTLTDSNLADLLHLLRKALSGRTNLPIEVTVTGELSLPAEVQITFYRVCQEALNNIAKYAKANHVKINLKQEGSIIEMCIRDDGQGFDPNQSYSGHYGLRMMRERAEAVGAQWSITSHPGHGTELSIRWTKKPAKEAI
jgi:PAS domain S-box-containing protein